MTAAPPDPPGSPDQRDADQDARSLAGPDPPIPGLVLAREIIALADPGEKSIDDFLLSHVRRLGLVHDGGECANATLFATIADSVEELARLRVARARFLDDGEPVRVRAMRLAVNADSDASAGLRLLDLRGDPSATLPALHERGQAVGSAEWKRLRSLLTQSALAGLLVTDAGGHTALVINLHSLRALLDTDLATIELYEQTFDHDELLQPPRGLVRLRRLNGHLGAYLREAHTTRALLSDLFVLLRQLKGPTTVVVVVSVAAIVRLVG